jgi:hypothetical protein
VINSQKTDLVIDAVAQTLACCLLDQLIRSRQHTRRNGEADLLGGFQVDDELELRRPP